MKIADKTYTLFGWEASFFTGKVRSYLRRKRIDFVEISPTIFDYYRTLPAKTGATAIPVVRTPDGQWLQDSSAIIDHLEAAFPLNPVLPDSPIQRVAALLLELWGDEFWIPTALHTRWNYLDENYAFLERDVGRDPLPGWPWPLQRVAARRVARHMSDYLPKAGVTPDQYDVLDRWTETRLDQLDAHFAEHDFLFGGRASIADFSIMGPLYGHLSRDPWPREHLIQPRKHILRWLERMNQTPAEAGAFLADDAVPPTLEPILRAALRETLPYLAANLELSRPYLARGDVVPRFLAPVSFPLADATYTRPAMPYILWMLQRLLDHWRAMPSGDGAKAVAWAARYGAEGLFGLDIPRVERRGLCIAAA